MHRHAYTETRTHREDLPYEAGERARANRPHKYKSDNQKAVAKKP